MTVICNTATLVFSTACSPASLNRLPFPDTNTRVSLPSSQGKREKNRGTIRFKHGPSSRGAALVYRVCASVHKRLSEVEAVSMSEDLFKVPASPGIYAVFDKAGELQYMGLTRRLTASLSNHVRELPELCGTVKFDVIDAPEKQALVDAWKQWMEEHLTLTGKLPPGNETGNTTWTTRKPRQSKPDIWLTPGPHVKLNISLEKLIDKVVKENKVVAFIKGSRTAPQCGFSHRVLTLLNENGIDYESVNVLDEEHNAGVREALKIYSQWPTLPQIFAHGEFIGGADIMEELASGGKVKEVLKS